MTTAPAISPEHARALLKQAIDCDPGSLALERVSARLEHSLLVAPLPPTQAPAMPVGPLAASPKLLVGLTLLAGVGIGVGLDRWATSRSQPAVTVVAGSRPPRQPLAAASTETPAVPADATPGVNAEALPLLPSAIPKRAASASIPEQVEGAKVEASPQAGLREQQALLDQARLALGQGQSDRCLAALAMHRSRFPTSLLAEERDALTIKALAAAGDLPGAREQAVAFATRYPKSLLLPSIEATVGTIR